MSALRMAVGELRRITAGRLPKFAALALAVIPLLYGGLYLYANHDPYGNLRTSPPRSSSRTPAPPPRRAAAARRPAGRERTWWRPGRSSGTARCAAEAEDGVRTGRYDFAVTMPADFSSALASSGRFEPRQGVLILTTNDANNYIARTIADRVTDQVRDSLARQVGEQAATTFLGGFATHPRPAEQGRRRRRAAGRAAPAGEDGAPTSSPPAPTSSPPGSGACSAGPRSWSPGRTRRRPAPGSCPPGRTALSGGLGQLRTATARCPRRRRRWRAAPARSRPATRRIASGGQPGGGRERTAGRLPRHLPRPARRRAAARGRAAARARADAGPDRPAPRARSRRRTGRCSRRPGSSTGCRPARRRWPPARRGSRRPRPG